MTAEQYASLLHRLLTAQIGRWCREAKIRTVCHKLPQSGCLIVGSIKGKEWGFGFTLAYPSEVMAEGAKDGEYLKVLAAYDAENLDKRFFQSLQREGVAN